MVLSLTFSALIAVAATVAVALPFLRRPRKAPRPERPSQLGLLERRDRALGALRELEFDHRTSKISDADYHRLLGPLRRETVEALRLVDDAGPGRGQPRQTAKRRRRGTPQTTGRTR